VIWRRRYAADRAFRQDDAADPENRLVAGELEVRWNRALSRVAACETRIAEPDAATPRPTPAPISLSALAEDLQGVWSAPTTDARLKKRIVRTLVQEAIADLDEERAEIVLTLPWVGGAHTEHRRPRRRRGQRTSTPTDVVDAVRTLALIARDDGIAGVLNRNGLKTSHGHRLTRERVTALRSHSRIPVFCEGVAGAEPWLNLSQAAALIGLRRAPCDWPRSEARSTRCILWQMDRGCSAAKISRARPSESSPGRRRAAQNTPRYRTLRSKACSYQ
jgi:hypothetical protein